MLKMNRFENTALTVSKWLLYIAAADVVVDGVQLVAMRQTRAPMTLIGMGLVAAVSFLSARRLSTSKVWPKITATIVFACFSIELARALKDDGFNVFRILMISIFGLCVFVLLKQLTVKLKAMASVRRGVKDAKAGRARSLGSFAKYLKDDDVDE